MHADEPRRGRRLCASCQYPLLRLDNFEGISSHDAPVAGDRSIDSSPMLRLGLLWTVGGILWGAMRRNGGQQSRKNQVARLRADILPEAPDAKICPMCLRVMFPDEL